MQGAGQDSPNCSENDLLVPPTTGARKNRKFPGVACEGPCFNPFRSSQPDGTGADNGIDERRELIGQGPAQIVSSKKTEEKLYGFSSVVKSYWGVYRFFNTDLFIW
jgi:hypothetical protein